MLGDSGTTIYLNKWIGGSELYNVSDSECEFSLLSKSNSHGVSFNKHVKHRSEGPGKL
jgi:hypothetical protein